MFFLNQFLSVPLCWVLLLAVPLVAWLIGGIPWGVILVRFLAGVDLRKVGSGNTGATNASRTMGSRGKALALFSSVFLLDFGKALLVLLPLNALSAPPGSMVWESSVLFVLAGAAVILGHCFSPWLGFKGGKGVATTCGVLLVLDWRLFGLGICLFLLLFFLFRMVSLGSMAMGLAWPLIWLVLPGHPLGSEGDWVGFSFLLALGLLILLRHGSNLARILAGKEAKVTFFSHKGGGA